METGGLRLTVAIVTLVIAYLWVGLLYSLISVYADPILIGWRFMIRWLAWPFFVLWHFVGYYRAWLQKFVNHERAVWLSFLGSVITIGVVLVFAWLLGACSLPPSCPTREVADTVAVMGRNSRGVVDTLGLSITYRRLCQ